MAPATILVQVLIAIPGRLAWGSDVTTPGRRLDPDPQGSFLPDHRRALPQAPPNGALDFAEELALHFPLRVIVDILGGRAMGTKPPFAAKPSARPSG